jgi:uncharacterized protein YifE (UPF0438 family)
MLHPPDHAALLARRDFVIPPGEFTPAERELLTKYGRWLEALAVGAIAPTTPGQEQFVAVAQGQRAPETDFERAWTQLMRQRATGDVVTRTFQAFAQARADKAAVEAEYTNARAAVLAQVRDQLAAIDEQFAGRLADTAEAVTTAEQALRDLVLRLKRTFHLAGIRATYQGARVTWDTPKLDAYAEQHPEVLAFRKVGKPWVNLRLNDKPPQGHPASPDPEPPLPDEEM